MKRILSISIIITIIFISNISYSQIYTIDSISNNSSGIIGLNNNSANIYFNGDSIDKYLKHKSVLIFYTTWAPPCSELMKKIHLLSTTNNINIITINLDNSEDKQLSAYLDYYLLKGKRINLKTSFDIMEKLFAIIEYEGVLIGVPTVLFLNDKSVYNMLIGDREYSDVLDYFNNYK